MTRQVENVVFVLCGQFFAGFKSSVEKKFVMFDKECLKKGENMIVVRFSYVENSVVIENLVFSRRRVIRG